MMSWNTQKQALIVLRHAFCAYNTDVKIVYIRIVEVERWYGNAGVAEPINIIS